MYMHVCMYGRDAIHVLPRQELNLVYQSCNWIGVIPGPGGILYHYFILVFHVPTIENGN